MSQRDEELLRVHGIVADGGRVDVVGSPGSGRTHLLDQLSADLLEEEWQVTSIRGTPSLKGVPLAALTVAGLAGSHVGFSAATSMATSVANCLAELGKRSARSRHLIAVDDWDAVDQVSQGVIEQASRNASTSLALSRPSVWLGSSDGDVDRGLTAAPTLSIALAPLPYDDLHDILRARLAGEIEASTMSRIYAKSDGNIGLSIAIVDAGLRESRIVKRDALWVGTADLWSPMLSSAISHFMAPLADADREAMELLSLTGVLDLQTAVDIVGDSAIDVLEGRQLIRLHPSARGYLVAVTPALLAEHIRRTQPVARRLRLRSAIEHRLADRDSLLAPLGDEGPYVESPAGFVSIIREQFQTRLLVTRAAWQHRPSADTAVPYLEALMADSAPPDRLDRVLEHSIDAPGSAEFRARLVVIRARHRAYGRGEVDQALADLRGAEGEVGEFAPLLRAWGVETETVRRAVPADAAQRLGLGDEEALDEPPSVTVARHWVAALAATAMGRLSESEQHLATVRRASGGELDARSAMVAALNLLGFGKMDRALDVALRGIEESRVGFDAEGLRRHSYVAALCYHLRGNYAGIEAVAEEVFRLGDPPEWPQVTQLALLAITTTAAHRQGKLKLARRYAAQLARLETPDGPLPGMVRQLSDIQVLASGRRLADAANLAQDVADGHWGRGYRYQAAFGYALSLEFDPTPARYSAIGDRLGAVEGEYFAAQRCYFEGLVQRDAPALAAMAERLAALGRPGQAIAALSRAAELFAGARKSKDASRMQELARNLIADNVPGSYDVDRYGGRPVRLTSREREIVSLIARGLSNTDIAARLTLSPRTVESHINHVIAKSGITAREEFKTLATRLGDY